MEILTAMGRVFIGGGKKMIKDQINPLTNCRFILCAE